MTKLTIVILAYIIMTISPPDHPDVSKKNGVDFLPQAVQELIQK